MLKERQSGAERRERPCGDDCTHDDVLSIKAGNKVKSIILYSLMSLALGGGGFSGWVVMSQNKAMANQTTDIAKHELRLTEHDKQFAEFKKLVEKMDTRQENNTAKILAAIQEISR